MSNEQWNVMLTEVRQLYRATSQIHSRTTIQQNPHTHQI